MTVLSKILLYGNVPHRVTENNLYELFLQFGPVDEVTLDTRSQVAVIIFKFSESVQYSIQALKYTELYGQRMELRPATDVENDNETARNSSNMNANPVAPNEFNGNQIESSTGRYTHKPDYPHSNANPYAGWGEMGRGGDVSYHHIIPYPHWGEYTSSHMNPREYPSYSHPANFNYYQPSGYNRNYDNERSRNQNRRYERGNWEAGGSSSRDAGYSHYSRHDSSRHDSSRHGSSHHYNTNERRNHRSDKRDAKRTKFN